MCVMLCSRNKPSNFHVFSVQESIKEITGVHFTYHHSENKIRLRIEAKTDLILICSQCGKKMREKKRLSKTFSNGVH